jgi:glycosyltransferase involved in cell wall biosynthesis
MRIAMLYHGRLPVQGYGGTGRVAHWLVRGLAELGHEVVLLAAPGSLVPEARLVPVDPRLAEHIGFDPRPLLPPGTDVLHAHRPIGSAGVPTLWTLHGTATRPDYPPNMVCLSADHAARSGSRTFVYNGLDPAEYRFSVAKEPFDLFLGRLHSAKGWQWAVRGARQAGRKLVVAGGWRPSLRPGIRKIGTVDGALKRDLLATASCLWMPARWEEPFGLTLIEAMVSGTPVLGTRRGSLPEIVTPETGALGTTLDELVALRAGIGRIDPEACRARVMELFTHRVMAARYLALYAQLSEQGVLEGGAGKGPAPDPS